MNILIVDDHPTNRKLLRALLEAEGITVCEAVDGRDALAVLDARPLDAPVDAIISDILMPNMDGYRFCWEVRHKLRFQHLPFAFYSSTFTAPGDEKLAREFGGDAFIAKPTGVLTILNELRDIRMRPRHEASPDLTPELDVMKHYSQRLIVKLEEQNAELQQRTAELEREAAERQRAQESLRQSEERFRALFDSGPIAIYSCDASGTIQEVNACAVALWGREPARVDSGERFGGSHKLYFPDGTLLPRAQSPMGKVLRGEIPAAYDQELLIERPDGSRSTVIANVVPLKNERGKITGAMCCFYDITERNRLQRETLEQAQALAEMDRRKDEFLAMLSHELRNPLAALSNAAQLLRLQKNEAPLQQQARHVIERQLGQLKHLVDDLLEVSRITSGRVQLRPERISVSGVVERAVETAQPLIAQRRHELKVSLPPEPVFLQADAARLEQVLVNLLNNAANYSDEGGHIWLSVEQEDAAAMKANGAAALPMVVIRVRDSGIGIAPELLPRIFDLFTQAERSIDRSQGGLGIGLCLVQRLVELHGGTVEAHSVLGQGSEFVVRLPLMLTALPASRLPALETAQTPEKGCRVLVIDDNVDAAQSLAKLLEITGHEVQVAYDGPSGLEAALAMRPDLVLLDIGLPGLDGYEVAQRMRQQATLKNIVLVALTGYGQDTDRQRSQEAGFDHHLVKPAKFAEIEKILAHLDERVA
jgi:PAS domain S-box-containing protein